MCERARLTWLRFTRMAMGEEVGDLHLRGKNIHVLRVRVHVKRGALAPQPPHHADAEQDQHRTDHALYVSGHQRRDYPAEESERAGNNQQHQGMAYAPGGAVEYAGLERTFATRQR